MFDAMISFFEREDDLNRNGVIGLCKSKRTYKRLFIIQYLRRTGKISNDQALDYIVCEFNPGGR